MHLNTLMLPQLLLLFPTSLNLATESQQIDNMTHWISFSGGKRWASFLTCLVCLDPCCLVCSGLCGLCRCWMTSRVFFWNLLRLSSCVTRSCVSPYCCCSRGTALKADACLSCSCPCCCRLGESCPLVFQYLGTKTKNPSVHSHNVLLLFRMNNRGNRLYLHVYSCRH